MKPSAETSKCRIWLDSFDKIVRSKVLIKKLKTCVFWQQIKNQSLSITFTKKLKSKDNFYNNASRVHCYFFLLLITQAFALHIF